MQKIIKKVLEELNKDKPDISYIRGLLEAVVEDQPLIVKGDFPVITPIHQEDEASLLDSQAKAALATVKSLNQEVND